MAYKINDYSQTLPKQAASAVGANLPVFSSASNGDQVVPVGTVNQHVLGITVATAASPGDAVAVQTQGVVKAVAIASLGPGADVGVGSTNGRLGPITVGTAVQAVGISQAAAADGVVFSVLLRPAGGGR